MRSDVITASEAQYASVIVPNLGDVASPISGIISHASDLGDPDVNGVYFKITNGGSATKALYFVKPLVQYQQLYFSLEYGNEFVVKKRYHTQSGDSPWEDAFDFIDFPTTYEPCNIGARGAGNTGTEFDFVVCSNSGELALQLEYNYLFTAI